jgi:hypothetical protein
VRGARCSRRVVRRTVPLHKKPSSPARPREPVRRGLPHDFAVRASIVHPACRLTAHERAIRPAIPCTPDAGRVHRIPPRARDDRDAPLGAKISKTTPCKVTWCRRHGCFDRSREDVLIRRRANQLRDAQRIGEARHIAGASAGDVALAANDFRRCARPAKSSARSTKEKNLTRRANHRHINSIAAIRPAPGDRRRAFSIRRHSRSRPNDG